MAVVTCEGGPRYFFSFKHSTPAYLVKTGGIWHDGIIAISDKPERLLLEALTAAIDAGTYGDNYAPGINV